jgi:hypothetical protein
MYKINYLKDHFHYAKQQIKYDFHQFNRYKKLIF